MPTNKKRRLWIEPLPSPSVSAVLGVSSGMIVASGALFTDALTDIGVSPLIDGAMTASVPYAEPYVPESSVSGSISEKVIVGIPMDVAATMVTTTITRHQRKNPLRARLLSDFLFNIVLTPGTFSASVCLLQSLYYLEREVVLQIEINQVTC
jgi:hypothetical protein